MPLPPGSQLGPYTVVSLIGTGGMGEVYQAHDPRLRRDIAVKVISKPLAGETVAVDRFIREALAVSALNHPNIVTIYEVGETDDGRFIAMELVQGRTLRDLIREGLDPQRATDLGRQVAEALAVAHQSQIVHRDVKPENVMMRLDGYAKVLDFGLARVERIVDGASATMSFATQTGLVLGTIGYMSPEQARGETVTTASDVFALGVVLYEALTGQHPFPAASPLGVLHAILTDVPVAPSRIRPELPASLDHLLLECLQKDARLRPTAADVADALRGATALRAPAGAAVPGTSRVHAIVGRATELQFLENAFAQATGGTGLVVAIAGEPGYGKTALVEHFLTLIAGRPEPVRIGRGRSSERLAGTDAYLPVLEALESLLRSESHGSLARVMKTVAPTWYMQLTSQPDHDADVVREAADGTGSAQRLKRELVAFLEETARLVPMAIFLDDVHWADGATVDLLAYLAARLPSMRVLIVTTHRPSELAHSRHPFLALKLDLQARGVCREIALGPLTLEAVRRYIADEFPDHALPVAFTTLVHDKTEGHPLFMVDLLRDLKRRGLIVERDGVWALADGLGSVEREVPESVRSMIQRKIDSLSNEDRQLLSAAAVQGADFDSSIVAYALELDEEDVEDRLDRLEREHAFVRFVEEQTCPDRTVTLRFRFSHVLYQNALFGSLRATRRATLAGSIASGLVRRWGDRAPEIALELAVLFETARGTLAAAQYFSLASQSAARLFAHGESEQLARRGLSLVQTLPDDQPRRGVELELQMSYALAIKTAHGYSDPAVGIAYTKARELCQRVDNPMQVLPVLMGLSAHYITAGEIFVARDLAHQLLEIAERLGDPHLLMVAEWCMGVAFHHFGELPIAHRHLLRAMELYVPAVHQARAWQVGIEPGIFCQCELARTTWLLGHPDEALARIERAEEQACALGHPQTLAFVLLFRLLIHLLRREPEAASPVRDALVMLCQDKGIAQELLWSRVVHGWILVERGEHAAGLEEMAGGLSEMAERHSNLIRPHYLQVYADALMRAGRFDDAAAALDEAEIVGRDSAQQMWIAEVHRSRGDLALARDPRGSDEAREHYTAALADARRQEALGFQLRAATALARLLADAGDHEQARHVLEPVYEAFIEGHATRDLQDARTPLRHLASGALPNAG